MHKNHSHQCFKNVGILILHLWQGARKYFACLKTILKEKDTFSNFSEFHFSIWAFVLIWVIFHCKFVESPLYLSFTCISGHSQCSVVVFHGNYQLCYQEDTHCKYDRRLRHSDPYEESRKICVTLPSRKTQIRVLWQNFKKVTWFF